ncbi:MAG: PRC-barrel domain-containing protein [Candidatus Hydrothermarchaeota archaeon]
MKKVYASDLAGKTVVSDKGRMVGSLYDITLDVETGTLLNLIIEPEKTKGPTQSVLQLPVDEEGFAKVPYDSVEAVSDVIVINEKKALTG